MSREELRSKSGCLSCRRRKKKCDETKPICRSCNRSFLPCTWPTEEQKAMDGRYRKELSLVSAKHQKLKLQVVPTFCAWNEPILLGYYGNSLGPSYLQRGAESQFQIMENAFKLVRQNETAKIAIMGCAAVSLSGKFNNDQNWCFKMKDKALSFRNSTVSSIQKQINEGAVDGTEDWLLLSACQLALADSLDNNTSACIIHMHGVMSLLKCRQLARMSPLGCYRPSKVSLSTERISYEAILFHAINIMVFDRSFSMLDQPWWHCFDDYFRATTLSTTFDEASWPILGMPFDLFRIAIVAHELNRRCPPCSEDRELAMRSLLQLGFFHRHIPSVGNFSAGYMYLVATTALLRRIISSQSEGINELSQELSRIPNTDISKVKANFDAGGFFIRFPVWPLVVLFRVSHDVGEKELLKQWIADSLRTFSGVTSRAAPQEVVDLFTVAPGL